MYNCLISACLVSVRICADGGANRLYDTLGTDELRKRYLPDCICGDLDSLRPQVRQFYQSMNVEILHKPSQYATDFQKCIDYLKENHETSEKDMKDILAFGTLSGRLDQTISGMSTLFHQHPLRKLYLGSNHSLATLIRPASTYVTANQIVVDSDTPVNRIYSAKGFEGPCCGIGSLGSDARVISTGLKWNLDRSFVLNINKMWSSSNAFANDDTPHRHEWNKTIDSNSQPISSVKNDVEYMLVTIDTDQPVLWTTEVDLA
ncbi:thiamine pyrophosphokinase, variant 2 [Batrachochytrium dendrobatidis]